MTMNGKLLYRAASLLMMLVLLTAVAVPTTNTVSAAVAVINDSFNSCTLASPWVWSDGEGDHAAPTITEAFQGNASLNIFVDPGEQGTISGANQNASRVLQPANDEPFELEVRFNSALGLTNTAGTYRMQGVLIRDNTDPTKPKWLRFDLDTNNATINYYVGYTSGEKVTQHFTGSTGGGVQPINASSAADVGTKIGVKYDPALGEWSMSYFLPGLGWANAFTFTEGAPPRGDAFTFTVTDIGVFAGSTGSTPPGHTAKVDYFYMASQEDDFEDDTVTLTVNKVGNGSVNWPVGAVCSGKQVTLTATPEAGSVFAGWSGDITNSQAQIQLIMDQTYNLLATFNEEEPEEPVVLPFNFFIPLIQR